jgi:hypothetical protein
MTVAEILTYIPVALVDDTVELLKMIISAPDQKEAIERAKLAIVADSADAATDAGLDAALKAESK